MKPHKPVYLAAGYNTVALGPGRPEFDPFRPRPGLLHHVEEAGRAVLAALPEPGLVDEAVIANFMAARFCRQGHLAALLPAIHPMLRGKPCTRVESACASGGLGLSVALKSVLAGAADLVLCLGVEVQNTVKALYGADYLAGAGWYERYRKGGAAYFFPGEFAKRAGAYFARYGRELTRQAMAGWYVQAVENARAEPKAQEYFNREDDLLARALEEPDPAAFLDHLTVRDCSKVSDGASAILVASERGLEQAGIPRRDTVRVAGFAHAADDLTQAPEDLCRLTTVEGAVRQAFSGTGLGAGDMGVLEIHDCFSITALLMLEAAGCAAAGRSGNLILAGETGRSGRHPTNTTGGLMGFGHATGGTGVRQAVDLWRQLTGRAEKCAVKLRKPQGMMINMGGNDRSAVCLILQGGG